MKSATHNGANEMSNAEHTYTVAGTSLFEGVVTYRFANSTKRMRASSAATGFSNSRYEIMVWR